MIYDGEQRRATQLTCKSCGRTLPTSEFERYPTGTYRKICRQCKYVRHTAPYKREARIRRLMFQLAISRRS